MREKILIVDDEQLMVKVLNFGFNKLGFDVHIANNSETALDRLETNTYDAVIADYNLRDKNGIWLLKKIRYRSSQTVRILMTGAMADDIEEYDENLVHYTCFKPNIDLEAIRDLIRDKLKGHISWIKKSY